MLIITHVLSSYKMLSFTYLPVLGTVLHFLVVPMGALRKPTLCVSLGGFVQDHIASDYENSSSDEG